MEVHHHPKVEKKTSKNIFWSYHDIPGCYDGFFCRNDPRDITEHSRAREFAESMCQDQ
jgi:hypothetical protein